MLVCLNIRSLDTEDSIVIYTDSDIWYSLKYRVILNYMLILQVVNIHIKISKKNLTCFTFRVIDDLRKYLKIKKNYLKALICNCIWIYMTQI